jgi:hypothetical protein
VNNVIMGTIKLILYALVLSGLLMKTNYIVTDWLGNFNQYTSNTANAPKNAMAAGSTALSYAAGAARGAVGMAQGGMKSGGSGGARKGGSGTPGTRGISEAERMNTILK